MLLPNIRITVPKFEEDEDNTTNYLTEREWELLECPPEPGEACYTNYLKTIAKKERLNHD